MLQDESALDWLHMMALISHKCASCTLPYGSKPDYTMETVPSVSSVSDINACELEKLVI